jgi:hypothetical protein
MDWQGEADLQDSMGISYRYPLVAKCVAIETETCPCGKSLWLSLDVRLGSPYSLGSIPFTTLGIASLPCFTAHSLNFGSFLEHGLM